MNRMLITRKYFTIILSIILLFTVVLPSTNTYSVVNELKVYFIDVGFGDATLIITPANDTILIDGGYSINRKKDRALITQLKNNFKIKTINYMILTHPDADHYGGLDDILEDGSINVRNILTPPINIKKKGYNDFLNKIKRKNINLVISSTGLNLKLKDINTKAVFLSPNNNASYKLTNDWSSVLSVTYYTNLKGKNSNKRFIFTGDAMHTAENDIISKYGKTLKADVLKIGHHGSDSSTFSNEDLKKIQLNTLEEGNESNSFISYVKPDYAIISVDEMRYQGRLPNNLVLQGLKLNKSVKYLYRTDRNGTILLITDGNIIKTKIQNGSNNK